MTYTIDKREIIMTKILKFLAMFGSIVILFSSFSSIAQSTDKILRVAHFGFNPQKGRFEMAFGSQSTWPLTAFADSMTYVLLDGSVAPGLATSWKAKDKTTWIFKIRSGVTFQNGAAMTADQIVKNVMFLVNDEKGKTSISARFLGLAGAKKIDETTVEITTKRPNPIFHRWANLLRIMDADYQKDVGIEGFTLAPIGTGPFKVTKWTGESMEAEAYKGAWRPAKFDMLRVDALTEPAARVSALESGQVDIAWSLSPDDVARLKGNGFKVEISPMFETVVFKFVNIPESTTIDNTPILDRRVRRALNYALDREKYVKEVLGGLTVAASQSGTRATLGYQKDIKPYPFDPAKAKKLLAEAGYSKGLDLTMEMIATSSDYINTSQFVAASLKEVGVNLEVRNISIPEILKRIRGIKPWDGHMWMGLTEAFPTGDIMRPFATDSCSFFGKFLCDKTIQPEVDAANQEFDLDKRAKHVRNVVKHYHDEALISYMYERITISGLSPKIKNYQIFNRAVNWHEIELN